MVHCSYDECEKAINNVIGRAEAESFNEIISLSMELHELVDLLIEDYIDSREDLNAQQYIPPYSPRYA